MKVRLEESNLYIKEVFVDSGLQMKRLRTAPQGRGYRIRKRSNHVTLVLDSKTAVN
jgi:large subunit ribosomal protein L22